LSFDIFYNIHLCKKGILTLYNIVVQLIEYDQALESAKSELE